MESDVRFFRRRANEEIAAAQRAVTDAAKARRLVLADAFLQRLKAVEACAASTQLDVVSSFRAMESRVCPHSFIEVK